MKISFWTIGKNNEAYIKTGVEEFTHRISKYFKVDWNIIPVPKNATMLSEVDMKKKEAEIILNLLSKPTRLPARMNRSDGSYSGGDDYLVALDEKGKQLSSEGLADFIQARANQSIKNLIFLIGGAYGLDESVLKRANYIWSLSQLTFPHQLVRLILAEQVYRACSILKNEKYHHK